MMQLLQGEGRTCVVNFWWLSCSVTLSMITQLLTFEIAPSSRLLKARGSANYGPPCISPMLWLPPLWLIREFIFGPGILRLSWKRETVVCARSVCLLPYLWWRLRALDWQLKGREFNSHQMLNINEMSCHFMDQRVTWLVDWGIDAWEALRMKIYDLNYILLFLLLLNIWLVSNKP